MLVQDRVLTVQEQVLVHKLCQHTQPTVEEQPTVSKPPVAALQDINLAVPAEVQPTGLLQWAGLQPMPQATLPTAQLSPIMALLTLHIQPVEPQDKAAPKETLHLPQTTAELNQATEAPLVPSFWIPGLELRQ